MPEGNIMNKTCKIGEVENTPNVPVTNSATDSISFEHILEKNIKTAGALTLAMKTIISNLGQAWTCSFWGFF